MTGLDVLRLELAARAAALCDAIRSIPPDLAPVKRASTVGVREQIWFGGELPLARASGGGLLFGKYEKDGWWSLGAAELVRSGGARAGQWLLQRDHVEPVSRIVDELLAVRRTREERAVLLEARLVTGIVLSDEHRKLAKTKGVGSGWARSEAAAITVRRGLG